MNHDGVNFFLVYWILGDSANRPITGAGVAGLDWRICHPVGPVEQVSVTEQGVLYRDYALSATCLIGQIDVLADEDESVTDWDSYPLEDSLHLPTPDLLVCTR